MDYPIPRNCIPDSLKGIIRFPGPSGIGSSRKLFIFYRAIEEIDLEENGVKMMGPYNPAEPLACLIKQLEKGRDFAYAVGQTIVDTMMFTKGVNLLINMATINEDIRECRL